MTLLNGGLQAVFGAAFSTLFADGVLHKTTLTDDGADGFAASSVDQPIKVMLESLSDQERVAVGLPRTAVRLTVLAAGLTGTIEIDDSVEVAGSTFRITQVAGDIAGASFALTGVPA